MSGRKIAIVGAGSAFFGPAVLVGLLGHEALGADRVALHDVDGEAVERMGRFAALLAAEGGDPARVTWGTDLARAVDGADVVIVSVAVDREATWARDREIALAHGIEHYAENGGPAATFHAGRNLALVLPVARELERRAPDAWLVNYTNPVARIGTALHRYTKVRALGVCHQLGFGYYMVGVLLADALGIALPDDVHFRWTDEGVAREASIGAAAAEAAHITAAGLNHLTWVLSLTRRSDGADLLPLLRERTRSFDATFEPLNRKAAELFGLFPVPGDCHLSEYLPFTHDAHRGAWGRYDIQMYDLAWSERQRQARRSLVDRIVATGDTAPARSFASERAEDIVAALLHGAPCTDESLDLPNDGAIENLPRGAIVETPVTFLRSGPRALACGALPPAVAELCRRQVTINELSVRGLVEGERAALLQALALDPMIADPDLPETLLDAYLRASERYLQPLLGRAAPL